MNKQLTIKKTYSSLEEVVNSPEWNEIFSPYAPSEGQRRAKTLSRHDFISAYVCEVDPSKNYGQAFKLFICYYGGHYFIKEVSAFAILSNAPFERVTVSNGQIEWTGDRRSHAADHGILRPGNYLWK